MCSCNRLVVHPDKTILWAPASGVSWHLKIEADGTMMRFNPDGTRSVIGGGPLWSKELRTRDRENAFLELVQTALADEVLSS